MPNKDYAYEFRVDHQGGPLADLVVENLGEGKVSVTSSDGAYHVTGPESQLKYLLQQLEDKLKEDSQFGLY